MTATLRFVEARDASAIQAIYAPYCEASAISFEIQAPTADQMADRIAKVTSQYPWLVCEVDERVVGYVYACQHRERAAYRWAVDVAVYIDPNHQRRGIGRALYTSLFAILREQGYFKACAGVTLPNPSSIGLHEAVGFQPVGVYQGVGFKLGQWRDVGWWLLELQPEIADPPEPTPIGQICNSNRIASALGAGEQLLGM